MEQIVVKDKDSMLIKLIKMLKNEQECSLDELDLLDEFPSTDVILPIVNCSPRRVIEYMKSLHARTHFRTCPYYRNINYKYKIRGINFTNTLEYTFTHNMSLVKDIIIICYLSCLRKQYLDLPGIKHLFDMMRGKYNIVTENELKHSPDFAITWSRVLYSFPSIALACTYAPTEISSSSDLCKYMDFLTTCIKKRMIWCNVIASVLPALESTRFPITCLVALKMELFQILKKINVSFRTETRLRPIHRNIISLCGSEAFPEALKFILCERWDIIQKVNEQHNQYKFVDYFEQHYPVASKILLDIESQESNA